MSDARFTLHYLRTTPDGRIALGGGGGRAGFSGRVGGAFTDDALSAARAAAGLRRLFPSLRDVRLEDAWGGPIDISADHLPWFGSVPGRAIHYGHGYSGNGVAPSVVGGRILAARALERSDDPALALPLADGALPRAFPPEPARYIGARLDPRGGRATGDSRGAWGVRWGRSCASSAGSRAGSGITSAPSSGRGARSRPAWRRRQRQRQRRIRALHR